MPDIFLSYNREDQAIARRFAEAFSAAGLDVWWDAALRSGEAYDQVTERALAGAKAVVVLWSPRSVESRWVRAEATQADRQGTLVPVMIEPCKRPIMFELTQTAELAHWAGDGADPAWLAFLADVRRFVEGEARAAPAAVVLAAPTKAAPPAREPLLAVLAFDNLSGDPEMAYFSDGVSEEIQQTVAQGAGLKVIGRTSSFQLRGAEKTVRKAAAQLGATHVLDGSVRRSGPRVRISAQLIECAKETTLWSERFDRELSDVFALQDEIAEAVAKALKVAFARSPEAAVEVDPAAYDLFLRAKDDGNGLTVGERVKLLQDVVAKMPRYAAGWAWASLYGSIWAQSPYLEEPYAYAALRDAAVAAAETAFKLDPRSSVAYVALSRLEPASNFVQRGEWLDKAVDAAPSSPLGISNRGEFLCQVGRVREGLDEAKRAFDLDPLNAFAANGYASMVGMTDYEDGMRLWEEFRARWPNALVYLLVPLASAPYRRDWARWETYAALARQSAWVDNPIIQETLAWGAARRDDDDGYRATLLTLIDAQISDLGAPRLDALQAGIGMGLRDEVFAAVERASWAEFDKSGMNRGGYYTSGIIFSETTNAEMIQDLRFVSLCAKLGLCDYWVSTGRWPDCADQVPYDFRAEARRLAGTA